MPFLSWLTLRFSKNSRLVVWTSGRGALVLVIGILTAFEVVLGSWYTGFGGYISLGKVDIMDYISFEPLPLNILGVHLCLSCIKKLGRNRGIFFKKFFQAIGDDDVEELILLEKHIGFIQFYG